MGLHISAEELLLYPPWCWSKFPHVNVRANVKVLEFQSFCILSCILTVFIILIKPLTTKVYDSHASHDCGTSGIMSLRYWVDTYSYSGSSNSVPENIPQVPLRIHAVPESTSSVITSSCLGFTVRWRHANCNSSLLVRRRDNMETEKV